MLILGVMSIFEGSLRKRRRFQGRGILGSILNNFRRLSRGLFVNICGGFSWRSIYGILVRKGRVNAK